MITAILFSHQLLRIKVAEVAGMPTPELSGNSVPRTSRWYPSENTIIVLTFILQTL